MTIKQKQWQLYYLGLYGESVKDIDGIWGDNSKAATTQFQKTFGIGVEGVFGKHTRNKSKETIDAIQEVIAKQTGLSLIDDGLAGPATVKATAKYQELMGLPVTGLADAVTRAHILKHIGTVVPEIKPDVPTASGGTFWETNPPKYFTRDEFRCKCGAYHKPYCNGFPAEPQEVLVRLCDRAREHFGRPAHLVSPLRCRQHNADSGGVANSQHMYGEAVDICIEGVTANNLYSWFKKQPEVRYTYKINNTNVHVDIPKGAR